MSDTPTAVAIVAPAPAIPRPWIPLVTVILGIIGTVALVVTVLVIPGSGPRTVRIWAGGGRGAQGSVQPNWQFHDGPLTGPILTGATVVQGANLTANQVRDAAGAVKFLAQWLGVDPDDVAAGDYVDVVVTADHITLRREATATGPIHMNCFAAARVS